MEFHSTSDNNKQDISKFISDLKKIKKGKLKVKEQGRNRNRQKVNKETAALNKRLDQMDLIH